jgi:CheY-like chemotaxis protein/cytidylate kinase
MSIITIFSGEYCNSDEIVKKTLAKTGYRLVTDRDIVAEASKMSGMPEDKIMKAFLAKTSVFNRFTHEKERSIAQIKLALAGMLSEDDLLVCGFSGLLIPRDITHALHICIIADVKSRIASAIKIKNITEKEAAGIIEKNDADNFAWVNLLFKTSDPWDASLYDIVIPTDKIDVDRAAEIIYENLSHEIIQATESSKKAVSDFIIAASVEVAMAKEGHAVGITSRDGAVTVTINTSVLMLGRLEEELKSIALKVPGVKTVETRVGKGFHKADIYRKYDFEMPSKVLLVDDEREFVQTLSERLVMRDMGSAITYDGESALELAKEDEPEVMILDLKMPGIDGIEVLRRIKETQPAIEVIILTGHGSEEDRKICMDLGAFAYLHKPVDINELSDTIKKANEKIRRTIDG